MSEASDNACFRPLESLRHRYAEELNPQQLAAVTAAPGPALVLAGAGSGKTRTLTYRVAYLLEQGVPAHRILLLTFTNKAAGEMMRRAAALAGAQQAGLWGGTFHSVGARILRRHAEQVGYRPDFTILDRDDAVRLLKTCLGEAKVEARGKHFPKPEALADLLSLAANTRTTLVEQMKRRPEWGQAPHVLATAERVAQIYAKRKQAANVMDFDDLLVQWLEMLKGHEALREHYQRRFQFILVDEYQDTNRLQCELVDLLAARHRNLMVVGDDAQSIYAWRGAEYRNILEFPQRYPDARIYKIEYNYRSSPQILALANAIMAGQPENFRKQLRAVQPDGPKPAVVACLDSQQQAAYVAHQIRELLAEGMPLNEIAVLYRSHFHSLELQLELTRAQLPFVITSGLRIFEQAHIKDVLAFLRLIFNPRDETSFKRLALMLPGIGEKAAEKLWLAFHGHWTQQAGESAAPAQVAASLAACSKLVPSRGATAWVDFLEVVRTLTAPEALNEGPAHLIRTIMKTGYENYLAENYPKAANRREDLEQLADYAEKFGTLEEFLTQMALLTNLEVEATPAGAGPEEKPRLVLSSIHQAKGLEWQAVFVIMLSEGMFPSRRSLESPGGLDEEYRLFYVAVTRARRYLYLCYPEMHLARYGAEYQPPSSFLEALPPPLVERQTLD
ncbi:ATP-dependent helicase [Fontisphaera persica]|uniref:ATP-dependent helicase n=1 Tax=Fontisphaera persica TaxID=2974023 RepID=UPI0024BFA87E|nr:ATP-dependent helicase [Fontisphaera persica]WCJ60124.1 ATP-dependent helicase [Fontisphaera persica]